ncbi:hypothetical protein ACMYR3_13505 [Ampullimonas aquatilis]|uniref:hypothetical protein n=1 Tax=Ampullimonas aquatilis TaxID=1341549 RepID=UPI003C758E83
MTIYRKTEKGQQEITLGSKGTLERRYRFHLIMIDGVTDAAELALRAPGHEDPAVVWATLLEAGFIEMVAGSGTTVTAAGDDKTQPVAVPVAPLHPLQTDMQTVASTVVSTVAPIIVPAVTPVVASAAEESQHANMTQAEISETEIAALIARLKAAKREALSIAVPLYGPDANGFLAKVLKAGSEDDLAQATRDCGERLQVMAGKKISKNFVSQVLKHIGLVE